MINFSRQTLNETNEESIHFRRYNRQFVRQYSIDGDVGRFFCGDGREPVVKKCIKLSPLHRQIV